jgi:hypothetical protein
MFESERPFTVDLPEDRLNCGRGLGTLSKLPLEIRAHIWLVKVKNEFPEFTYARLERVSPWIAFECYHILLAGRILTFDISCYEHVASRWPSEFHVHDQFDCYWRVAPQFGGECGTLEGAEILRDAAGDILEHSQRMRIRVAAPRDAGELLMLWNRMRWIASFLDSVESWNEVDIIFEFLEGHSRSWWNLSFGDQSVPELLPLEDFFPSLLDDRGRCKDWRLGRLLPIHLARGTLLSFTLSPFSKWEKLAIFCFRRPNTVCEEKRQSQVCSARCYQSKSVGRYCEPPSGPGYGAAWLRRGTDDGTGVSLAIHRL